MNIMHTDPNFTQTDADDLCEALAFYSDPINYKTSKLQWDKSTAPPTLRYPLGWPDDKISEDGGRIARAAIAKHRAKKGGV